MGISGILTLRVWWVTAGVEAARFFGSIKVVGVGWLVMALGAVRPRDGRHSKRHEETLDSFAFGRASDGGSPGPLILLRTGGGFCGSPCDAGGALIGGSPCDAGGTLIAKRVVPAARCSASSCALWASPVLAGGDFIGGAFCASPVIAGGDFIGGAFCASGGSSDAGGALIVGGGFNVGGAFFVVGGGSVVCGGTRSGSLGGTFGGDSAGIGCPGALASPSRLI